MTESHDHSARLMSALSHRTLVSQKRKFVFHEDQRHNTVSGTRSLSLSHPNEEDLILQDSSSSSEDSLEDQDLENDLMAFDDEQAAVIRNINKHVGSFRSIQPETKG